MLVHDTDLLFQLRIFSFLGHDNTKTEIKYTTFYNFLSFQYYHLKTNITFSWAWTGKLYVLWSCVRKRGLNGPDLRETSLEINLYHAQAGSKAHSSSWSRLFLTGESHDISHQNKLGHPRAANRNISEMFEIWPSLTVSVNCWAPKWLVGISRVAIRN